MRVLKLSMICPVATAVLLPFLGMADERVVVIPVAFAVLAQTSDVL